MIVVFIMGAMLLGEDDTVLSQDQERCLDIQRRLAMQPSYRRHSGLLAPVAMMSAGRPALRVLRAPLAVLSVCWVWRRPRLARWRRFQFPPFAPFVLPCRHC